MAQRLEAGNGHTELFAGVQVLGGQGNGFVHHANGLGAQRGGAHVNGLLQGSQAIAREQRGGCVDQCDIGGTAAVLAQVPGAAGTGCAARHQEQGHFGAVCAIQHGGHDPGISLVTGRHHVFSSCQRI